MLRKESELVYKDLRKSNRTTHRKHYANHTHELKNFQPINRFTQTQTPALAKKSDRNNAQPKKTTHNQNYQTTNPSNNAFISSVLDLIFYRSEQFFRFWSASCHVVLRPTRTFANTFACPALWKTSGIRVPSISFLQTIVVSSILRRSSPRSITVSKIVFLFYHHWTFGHIQVTSLVNSFDTLICIISFPFEIWIGVSRGPLTDW